MLHIQLIEAVRNDIQEFLSKSTYNDSQVFSCLKLEQELFKKLSTSRDEGTKNRAIEKWHVANNLCAAEFSPPLEDTPVALAYGYARDFFHSLVINRTAGSSQDLITSIKPEDGLFGPGKSLGCEDELFVTKLRESEHTFTSLALKAFYRKSLLENPRLFDLEVHRARTYGQTIVDASKLTTVPKNDTIDRVICIEPLLNMFYQQAVRAFLERRLKTVGINFSNQQDIQRLLAKKGSIDGSLVTIDLSSASDTISLNFCRKFLPEALLSELLLCRTQYTMIGDEKVELNMISSMGNATTFPLQTMIFLSLVVGCFKAMDEKPIFRGTHRNLGVFGDDIIIPNNLALLLCELLTLCGFKVNTAKSFITGLFRESCGGDYLAGENVTPIRIKNLEKVTDLFSSYNRLLLWSAEQGIPLLGTLRLIRKSIRKPNYVPIGDNVDSGLWVDMKPDSWYYRRLPVSARKKVVGCISTFLHGCITQRDDLECFAELRHSTRTRLVRTWFPGQVFRSGSSTGRPIKFYWVDSFLDQLQIRPVCSTDGMPERRIKSLLQSLQA
jgi:hypothetical protein